LEKKKHLKKHLILMKIDASSLIFSGCKFNKILTNYCQEINGREMKMTKIS
jgi:hypothetical protein